MGLIFPLLLVGAVYFLMLRPQQQRVARQRQLVASLDVGDEVVTAGGIIGFVRRLDEERLWLEVAPGIEITLLRGAVAQRVIPPAADDNEPAAGEDERDEGFDGP